MDRSRLAPSALLRLATLASASLVAAACTPPAGECQSYGDCPAGEFCQDGTCVGDNVPDAGTTRRDGGPVPGNRDAGPAPDGGEPGDGEGDEQVRTTFAVPWIQEDPRDPSRILFAEQQESGGVLTVDRVRAIDVTSLRVENGEVYDLSTLASGACRADSIVFVDEADETWFNCDLPPGLRIIFGDDDVAQPGNTEALSAHVVHVVPGPGTGLDFTRMLVAERGGQLRVWQLRDTDGFEQQRFIDTLGTPVNGVVAIFDLEDAGVPGMHVVVHDALAARLVPLTRDPGADTWTATAALDPLTLPAETHVVWRIGPIAADGNADEPNEPNIVTLEPSTGEARYWNYETAQPILPATIFESDPQHRGPAPSADERLLLAPSPSGDFLFYARAEADKIYRIPLVPGGDALVRERLLDDTSRVISSLLAIDDDMVWVSYANDNLVERLVVDELP